MCIACYQNTTDARMAWQVEPRLGVDLFADVDRSKSGWPGAPDSIERCNQLCLSTGVAFKCLLHSTQATIVDGWQQKLTQATIARSRYFGMQAGHACFCGMEYGGQGKAAEADCNAPCLGNSSQFCGGPFLNSVWATQPL